MEVLTGSLRTTRTASLGAASLLARLLIEGVFLQLTKKAALLHLLVEALQRRVNRFIGLYVHVDQSFIRLPSPHIMPYSAQMRRILRPWAITGGIAEGKSTVLGYLAEAGYRTLSADAVAREVFETAEMQLHIRAELRTRDRAELRQLIASDPDARRRLNALMHGPVWKAILDQESDFVEVPLLIETVLHPFFDGVWVVTCGEGEQRRRLSERFFGDVAKAEALIQAQLPSRVKAVFADRVFDSNLPEPHVRREVLEAVSRVFRP